MFQKITKIPTDENYTELSYQDIHVDIRDIYDKMYNLYGDSYFTSYFAYNSPTRAIEEFSCYIDGMNCDGSDYKTVETEYTRNESNLDWLFTST